MQTLKDLIQALTKMAETKQYGQLYNINQVDIVADVIGYITGVSNDNIKEFKGYTYEHSTTVEESIKQLSNLSTLIEEFKIITQTPVNEDKTEYYISLYEEMYNILANHY